VRPEHFASHSPVAALNLWQMLHAKQELAALFGQLQNVSGAPLAVRGLEGIESGHFWQFGGVPYSPCLQQLMIAQPKFSCLSPNKIQITIIITPIINKYILYIYL
jgi:hypothetical protein